MRTSDVPSEKVYFVYNTKTKRRSSKFYSCIGPAKSYITSRRGRSAQDSITTTYVICEMVVKFDACNQYRYDENKKSMELTDLAKAIYL